MILNLDKLIDLMGIESLAALAEECSELAQAALKYRRCLDGTNWTPKSAEECQDNIREEIGDVLCCLIVSGFVEEDQTVGSLLSPAKADRWLARLEAHQKEAGHG